VNRVTISPQRKNAAPTNRDPLIACYEELNSLWKLAEEELAAMRVAVYVEVPLSRSRSGGGSDPDNPEWRETYCLCWCKPDKDWRLCLGTTRGYMDNQEEWHMRPVAECPMEDRIELAKQFPALKAKMEEARQKMIPLVSDAIAALKNALSK
jgi:hypothetical protein